MRKAPCIAGRFFMLCCAGLGWGGFSSGWDTEAGVQLNILAITRNISTIRQGISAYRQSKTKEIPYIPRNMW